MKDYVDQALQTASNTFHGEFVTEHRFENCIAACISNLRELDSIKRAIFYGQGFAFDSGKTCIAFPDRVDPEDPKRAELIIHGLIGAATEVGELLEVLQAVLFNQPTSIDEVNIKEEVGDVFWYFALLASSLGFTFEEAQEANIAKLRARFPNKFTEFDALNRDLSNERKILELK